jgi:hypothetical protein
VVTVTDEVTSGDNVLLDDDGMTLTLTIAVTATAAQIDIEVIG